MGLLSLSVVSYLLVYEVGLPRPRVPLGAPSRGVVIGNRTMYSGPD